MNISIIISVAALLVSGATFQWNKAKHNLNQLQDNADKFLANLQKFLDYNNDYQLFKFKYEIENIIFIKDKEKRDNEFNKLQQELGREKSECKSIYIQTSERLEFMLTDSMVFDDNKFVKWLNSNLNDYFYKMDLFRNNLMEIAEIVIKARSGMLEKESIKFVEEHYNLILDLLIYHGVFSSFKKLMVGHVGQLSVSDVGLFGNTKKALKNIKSELLNKIKILDFDAAIKEKNFEKMQKYNINFGNGYAKNVEYEKKQFILFLKAINYMK